MLFKLFNTLGRKVVTFKPINQEKIRIYSCGPTVYDYPHIGNLRAFLFADTLYRWFKYGEKSNVQWVMNITDVDDKTINKSKDQYPELDPKQALQKFTRKYEEIFFEDLKTLGIDYFATQDISTGENKNPRATDFISQMQDLIRKICQNGYGKVIDGSVFFDVGKYAKDKKYGVLLNLDLKNLKTGTRTLKDETTKDNLEDFVLWKAKKEGEPSWDFFFDLFPEIKISETKNKKEIEIIKKIRWERLLCPFGFLESEKEFREGEKRFVVAKFEKEILGFATFGFDKKNKAVRIRSLFVDEKFRKKGIGRKIISFIESKISEFPTKKIFVNSEKSAVEFYEEIGFSKNGKIKKVFNANIFEMEKIINSKNKILKIPNLPGRPGWHIECSAMGGDLLDLPFDIHTGGVDLVFPHHENEIAQAEAGIGKSTANYWMHNEHLLIEGLKMSKRLNNFFTLKDLLKKGHKADAIRFFLVTNHYRGKLNLTEEALKGAESALQRIRNKLALLSKVDSKTKKSQIDDYKKQFYQAMQDDLNAPNAIAVLFKLLDDDNIKTENILEFFKFAENVFGVRFLPKEEQIPAKIIKLAEERQKAKNSKEWDKADEIRQKILQEGYEIRDEKDGFEIVLKDK